MFHATLSLSPLFSFKHCARAETSHDGDLDLASSDIAQIRAKANLCPISTAS